MVNIFLTEEQLAEIRARVKSEEDQYVKVSLAILEENIEKLKTAALKFSTDCIHDALVRQKYLEGISTMAESIKKEVDTGRVTAKEGAHVAQQLRNAIMEEARKVNSLTGKTISIALKSEGKSFDYLFKKYSQQEFGVSPESLTKDQKVEVFKIMVKKSGVDNAGVTTTSKVLALGGRVCILVTFAMGTYAIITSDDPFREGYVQTGGVAGGVAGAYMGGAIALDFMWLSAACGPGAPICLVGLFLFGVVVGGAVGQRAGEAVGGKSVDVVRGFTHQEVLQELLRWEIF